MTQVKTQPFLQPIKAIQSQQARVIQENNSLFL